ncbi:MFS transporter [Pseudodesulfovibrio sp.]|uniref:MFS transporter n=1 Tax=Pseudodesulfovibrio sp. TaxID=2035812 RepID=UPI00262E2F83|nr:MFS transporter [Pseudodesulfovibrio sp.]MDD3312380.1 MFS transporter [Pseudodesulfovibrio sp.]
MRRIYLDKNLQFVFGVTLMAVLGVSSIVPALPGIMDGLSIGPVQIGLVISAFTLPGVIFSPLMGVLADRMGRRIVLVPALFVFGGFGFACFFARTMPELLALRFVQGVGASPLGVLYGTIIGDLYHGPERGQAMGYNASALAMGTALYPAIGGILAILGWNYPFLLPLLAIPLGVAIIFHMDIPNPDRQGSFAEYLRGALRRMRTRRALSLFATTLVTFVILYGPIITYLPLLLDARYEASAPMIGAVFLIASGFTGLASFQLGRLAERFGQRTLLLAASVFYALSMLLMPLAPGLWYVVPPVICFGLAQGLNIPTVMTMLTTIAPMEQRGAFMAANGFLLRLAQTVAPLLMGGLFALFGMQAVYLGGLACAVILFALAFFCIEK